MSLITWVPHHHFHWDTNSTKKKIWPPGWQRKKKTKNPNPSESRPLPKNRRINDRNIPSPEKDCRGNLFLRTYKRILTGPQPPQNLHRYPCSLETNGPPGVWGTSSTFYHHRRVKLLWAVENPVNIIAFWWFVGELFYQLFFQSEKAIL